MVSNQENQVAPSRTLYSTPLPATKKIRCSFRPAFSGFSCPQKRLARFQKRTTSQRNQPNSPMLPFNTLEATALRSSSQPTRKPETMTTATTTRPEITTYDHQTREGLKTLAYEAFRQATRRGIMDRAGDIYAQAIEDINKHVSKTAPNLNRKKGYKPSDVIRQATGHVFERDASRNRHKLEHHHTSEPGVLSVLISNDPGQYLIDRYTRMFDVYTAISEATECGRMLAAIDRRAIAATKPPAITLAQPGLRWQPPTPANPAPLAEPTRRAIDRRNQRNQRNQQARPQLASA